ncbi:MAG: transposase [Oscillospiraceae bacterium]|nr:transposase [Oscillospiraceae bacterium]
MDSTPIKVCNSHRIYGYRVFSEYARMGKSSMSWFYGFKLHLMINDEGEILSFCLTSGNVDDRNEEVMDSLTKKYLENFLLTGDIFLRSCLKNCWKKRLPLSPEQRKIRKIS